MAIDFGSLFGGIASGAEKGFSIAGQQEDREIKRMMFAQQEKVRMTALENDFRKRLDQIPQIQDPAMRKIAINQAVEYSQKTFGVAVPKDIAQLAATNPERFGELLKMGDSMGLTAGQAIQLFSSNPLTAVDLMVAADQEKRRQAALPTAEPATPQPSGANVETTPLAPQGTSSSVSTGDPKIDAEVQKRLERLGALRQELVRVGKGVGVLDPRFTSANLTSIRNEMAAIQKEITDMTVGQHLEKAKEGRQVVPQAELDEARAAARRAGVSVAASDRMFPTGMTREAFKARQSGVGVEATPLKSVETAPSPAGKVVPEVTTPGQLPLDRKMQELEAETNAAKRRELAAASIKLSFKTLEDIQTTAQTAKGTRDTLSVLAGAATRVGPTGPWVTPVRETVNSLAQLLGIKNPSGQGELQLITSLNSKLAIAITAGMKGQQSDKELGLAIVSAPGTMQGPRGLAVMTFVANEFAKRTIAHEQYATEWSNKYGELNARDEQGRTFNQVWEASLRAYNAQRGSLAERTGKALKLDPKALLRGIVKESR